MLGMLMPQITPLLTLTLVCTWYEEATPQGHYNKFPKARFAPNPYLQHRSTYF